MKPRLNTFIVSPYLPQRLRGLAKLAYNLWWCWHPEAIELFSRIDPELWHQVNHSPIRMAAEIEQEKLDALAQDDGFLAHLDRVEGKLDHYLKRQGWFQQTYPNSEMKIAYFSAEFGIHESVPIYSGGLGILAGDHLKSASDLCLPMVGVSLMYRQGYFRQYMNSEGWQQEQYPENDFYNLPLIAEKDEHGKALIVSVPFPGRDVFCKVWRIQVGRIPLYLLDCNLPQNRPEDRDITGQLYGGDLENRIKQEMVLGIGGYRAIRSLNFRPTVCHMNEGHSAFLALERIRFAMERYGMNFLEAKELVTSGNVFTTHTPVPAGNDRFPPHYMDHYLAYYVQKLGITKEELLTLGRENPTDATESFCMTVLALKLSNFSNGVSKLHGKVSRNMWKGLWPKLPEAEIPISHITNGVHVPGWVSSDLDSLYRRYLGWHPGERPCDHNCWQQIDKIPDGELWRLLGRNRQQLIIFARKRLTQQLTQTGATPKELAEADEVLDPEVLTIAFARRSATYKRGTLIFKDLDRLASILNHKEHPVQLVFSGKAHPHDKAGKELLKEMIQISRRPEFRHRIVFLENYDINVARYLVQGVDIWLNNPRRPLEASGTSGMKATANGGIHLSILDGWWDEGYAKNNGFAIGQGEEYADLEYQDTVENHALYDILEKEIVPLYYQRGSDGIPHEWIRYIKNSLKTLTPFFNTNRMVQDYIRLSYSPSHERHEALFADQQKGAKEFAHWKQDVEQGWTDIRIDQIHSVGLGEMIVGKRLEVSARVFLGKLSPEHVSVQLWFGAVDALGQISQPLVEPMSTTGSQDQGGYRYSGNFACLKSGQMGFAIRVIPKHDSLTNPLTLGCVTWS